MHFWKNLLVGSVAAGLVGCSGSASGPPSASRSPTGVTKTEPAAAAPAVTAGPATKAAVRASVARFYGLYSASRFAASWDLLAPAAKRLVQRDVWVRVHEGCPSASTRAGRVIKSVTIFGNAAIVIETIAGASSKSGTAEDVFNYANGRWGYSPNDLGVYHHGSVAADIAAAKAARICATS